MANTNKEEYVDLFVAKEFANDDPNEFISLNGVNYIVPRGTTTKVPPNVKKQYEKSLKAKARLYATSEKLIEKAKQPFEM